jgi:hypothetical protein
MISFTEVAEDFKKKCLSNSTNETIACQMMTAFYAGAIALRGVQYEVVMNIQGEASSMALRNIFEELKLGVISSFGALAASHGLDEARVKELMDEMKKSIVEQETAH